MSRACEQCGSALVHTHEMILEWPGEFDDLADAATLRSDLARVIAERDTLARTITARDADVADLGKMVEEAEERARKAEEERDTMWGAETTRAIVAREEMAARLAAETRAREEAERKLHRFGVGAKPSCLQREGGEHYQCSHLYEEQRAALATIARLRAALQHVDEAADEYTMRRIALDALAAPAPAQAGKSGHEVLADFDDARFPLTPAAKTPEPKGAPAGLGRCGKTTTAGRWCDAPAVVRHDAGGGLTFDLCDEHRCVCCGKTEPKAAEEPRWDCATAECEGLAYYCVTCRDRASSPSPSAPALVEARASGVVEGYDRVLASMRKHRDAWEHIDSAEQALGSAIEWIEGMRSAAAALRGAEGETPPPKGCGGSGFLNMQTQLSPWPRCPGCPDCRPGVKS